MKQAIVPGNHVPAPSVAATWDLEQWEQYRRDVLTCAGRPDSAAWWKNVGSRCVVMADRNIERLRSSAADV